MANSKEAQPVEFSADLSQFLRMARKSLAVIKAKNIIIAIPAQGSFSLWAPWAFCIGAAAYFYPLSEPNRAVPVLVITLCLAAGFLLRKQVNAHGVWLIFVLGLLASFTAGWGVAQWRTHARAAPVLAGYSTVYQGEGLVLAVDKERGHRARYLIAPKSLGRLNAEQLPKRIRMSSFSGDAEPGDQVRFTAALQAPQNAHFTGAYNFALTAWFKGIGGTGFSYGHIHQTGRAEDTDAGLNLGLVKKRRAMALRIRADLPGQKGAIAAALVTGDRSAITEDAAEDLRIAGLAHMLAISGLHMGLVAGLVFASFAMMLAAIPAIGRRFDARKPAAIMGLLAALSYLVLSGASAPTQRAFVMTAVVFVAILFNRRALSIRTISLAALVVALLAPESVISPGFQMSFAAALSLIAFYEWAGSRVRFLPFSTRATPLALFMRVIAVLAALALTSFIAGLATGPFAAFYFHRASVYGLIANMAAMPVFTFVVMPSLLVGALLDTVGAGGVFFTIAGWGLELILKIAHGVAQMPGAIARVPAAPPLVPGLIAIGLLFMCLLRKIRRLWGLALITLGLIVWTMIPRPDGLLTKDGGLIRIALNGKEQIVSFGGVSRFKREQFASALAIGPENTMALKKSAKHLSCDASGCTANLTDGRLVAIALDGSQLDEDCRLANLVITPKWPTLRNAANCPQGKLISLATTKGLPSILYLNKKTELRRAAARARPWAKGD